MGGGFLAEARRGGLGIGGSVVGVVALLVLWVLPVVIDQVVTPKFTALEPKFTALEQHMVDLQQDLAHLKEDVADVREDLAYVKGQVDLLIQLSVPGGADS